MATAATYGKMGGNMKANIKMTRSMAMERIPGQMVVSTKEIGKTASSMVVVNMCQNKVYQEREFGTRAKGKGG